MNAMVTWPPAGRAGNFFFMCAAAWCYAKRYGLEFSVPNHTTSEVWNPIYLQHLVHPNYTPHKPEVSIYENSFSYQELKYDPGWKNLDYNIVLRGYWQSYKYFWDLREGMLDAWGLPWHHIPDVCSVHARYGDYLVIPGKHILVDEGYLLAAIDLIKNNTGIRRFKVFSDDIALFKERHGHIYNFEYSTNGDIISDLTEMSCCHSHINSSSTFAYWAAILNRNPDKVVVTQEKWFQDGWMDEYRRPVDTSDLLPPEWIKI